MKAHIAKSLNFLLWLPKAWCYYSIAVNVLFLIDLPAKLAGNSLLTGNTLANENALFNLSIISLVNTSKFVFGLCIIYEFQRFYRAKLNPVVPVIA